MSEKKPVEITRENDKEIFDAYDKCIEFRKEAEFIEKQFDVAKQKIKLLKDEMWLEIKRKYPEMEHLEMSSCRTKALLSEDIKDDEDEEKPSFADILQKLAETMKKD